MELIQMDYLCNGISTSRYHVRDVLNALHLVFSEKKCPFRNIICYIVFAIVWFLSHQLWFWSPMHFQVYLYGTDDVHHFPTLLFKFTPLGTSVMGKRTERWYFVGMLLFMLVNLLFQSCKPTREGIQLKEMELSLCCLLILYAISFKIIIEWVKQILISETAAQVSVKNILFGSWFVQMF
jgi:hypothetical protein